MIMNNRKQRCIQLFDRFKAQFLRVSALEDADRGFYPNQESNNFNRRMAEQDAALLVTLLARFTSHMSIDDFNTNWFFYSDYIYQDEDEDARENVSKDETEELNA